MTRRKAHYDPNLPRNLTFRRRCRSYYWRNPVTGKEISMGKISRRDAVSQALEANHFIEENYSPVSLLDKLKGTEEFTLSAWIKRYSVIFRRRGLTEKVCKYRDRLLCVIEDKMGDMLLSKIETRHIAGFLELWVVQDKLSMAVTMRSLLSDIFREAIVEGCIANNPVTPTRACIPTVKRERLELEQYKAIRAAAETLGPWFGMAMDLALVTGQRREDVAGLRFDHIVNGRLLITQGKTGMKLSLPLDLELRELNLKLGTVVDRCRLASRAEYMLSAGMRKNSADGALNADALTKNFVKARNIAGIDFEANPPTFHEIRSLAGRCYEKEKGKEYAQKLLGHKSEKMTEKYLDTRGKEYVTL